MRRVILILFILLTAVNFGQISLQILENQRLQGGVHLHNLGDQFKGLEPIFNHMPMAGYYTDKPIERPMVIAQFEQAQYVLAPTVLDLNHTDYPLVLFDCSSPEVALNKIKELGFQPVKANNLGIILAFNPQAKNP